MREKDERNDESEGSRNKTLRSRTREREGSKISRGKSVTITRGCKPFFGSSSSYATPSCANRGRIHQVRVGAKMTPGASIAAGSSRRGAFILFEGVDRCGKSTQCKLLVQNLQSRGIEAELWRYPDRTTAIGQMIDKYLQSQTDMDDASIHLLFSANRWEKR